MRIIRHLKKWKGTVFLIVCLLVVQAYCDLSLPTYTSQIVDVGIQQGGIADAVPDTIRKDTLSDLELFMTDEETKTVEAAYTENSNGIYQLNKINVKTRDALNKALGESMVILSQMEESGKMTTDQIYAAIKGGQLTEQQLLAMKDQALDALGSMSDSIITQKAITFVQAEYKAQGIDLNARQTSYLWITGGKMLALTLLMVCVSILAGMLASRTAAALGRDLRAGVFQRVVSFSNTEMDQFSTASLITRSTNDVQQIQQVTVMLLRMVMYAPIMGFGGVLKVVTTNTGMGWIIGVAVGTVLALILVLMSVTMPKFKRMQTLVDRLNLVSREILTGIPVIRAFSREKHEEERFNVASRDLMNTQLFTNRAMSVMMPAMMLIMNGITVMIVWFGAKGIDLGNMQVGDMIAFITYTMQIIMAFMMMTMISIMLPRANVAAERIDEVIATEPVIEDKPQVLDNSRKDWKGVVSFRDVSFRFPNAESDALHSINFTAEPGKTTAIIGSTGSGKSTLVNLIPRFYDVTGGSVLIDDADIRDLSQHKLHSLMGFVPQKGVLFSGDIASNLKFGGDDITDEQMVEAAQIAQATEFIDQKPEGYHSPIAQGGTNVSGGQKQRLSIARAIAKNPKILIFDDSFSALDYKTDVVLRHALSEKAKDATVLIVAQRISTILHADQIIVLDEGQIVGVGTHEELMRSCATYQEIARSQLSEAELGLKEGDAR